MLFKVEKMVLVVLTRLICFTRVDAYVLVWSYTATGRSLCRGDSTLFTLFCKVNVFYPIFNKFSGKTRFFN